jgi:hypothetical protein
MQSPQKHTQNPGSLPGERAVLYALMQENCIFATRKAAAFIFLFLRHRTRPAALARGNPWVLFQNVQKASCFSAGNTANTTQFTRYEFFIGKIVDTLKKPRYN